MLLAILLAPLIALFQAAPSPSSELQAPSSLSAELRTALSPNPETPLTPTLAPSASDLASPGSDANLQARIYAARTSVQPGSDVDLAIELRFAPGWHIYHPVILDTGYATTVKFEDLPEGVTVDPLQFPTPKLSVDTQGGLKQEYLGLDSPVVVLTKLHVAPDVAPGPLTLKAAADALACKKSCVPASAEASLTLPVSTEPPASANEKLFEDARRPLPQQLTQAEYITGSRALPAHTQVPVGQRSSIVASIPIKGGHHIQDRHPIQSSKPGSANLVASRLYVERPDGLKLLEQTWPQPRVKKSADGDARELAGDLLIDAPFEIEEGAELGPVRLRVLFEYQTCTDTGTCYPPTFAEGTVDFEIVPANAPAVASTDPLLAQRSDAPRITTAAPSQAAPVKAAPNLLFVFLAAFAGGMILNIMPCVLPVISLKIFGFVQQAHDDRGRIFRMGLAYSCGILASFLLLAVLMVYAGLAWGGLMQRPEFLIGLVAVVFAFALSLLGVYEINLPGSIASAAGEAAAHGGYVGAFMNGILTTLLATSCVAPLLGSAVGILTQLPNPYLAGAGIMVVGAGLATPYLLLTAFPSWLRFLPKPGPWMVTFKQIVGFILIAVVVWLLSILMKMIDHETLQGTLGLVCAIAVGSWMIGRIRLSDSTGRWAAHWCLALLLAGGGGWLSYWIFAKGVERVPWQQWSPGLAEKLAADGNTVFLDYTAEWCPNCKTVEKVVLNSNTVANEFSKLGVYPIRADFTRHDPQMFAEIRKHGRPGVPTYVVFPAGKPDQPIVLGEAPFTQEVLDALKKAGPSQRKPDFWTAPP